MQTGEVELGNLREGRSKHASEGPSTAVTLSQVPTSQVQSSCP